MTSRIGWLPETRSLTEFQTLPVAEVLTSFGLTALPEVLAGVSGALPAGAFVAGGRLAEMLAGLPPQDIDVWCAKVDAASNTVSNVYAAACRALRRQLAGGEYVEVVRPLATVFSAPTQKVAVHDYAFDDVSHVLDSFDFTVVQIALVGETFVVGPTTLADIRARRLIYARAPHAGNTPATRVPYFLRKGFEATEELAEQVRPISQLLAHQLQGARSRTVVPTPKEVEVPLPPAQDPPTV